MAGEKGAKSSSSRCEKCGTLLVGTAFREIEGKKYCEKCYRELVAEKKNFDNALQDLYNYIKEVFGITEIPPDIAGAVMRQITYDRAKPRGLKATIWYYYKVLGNTPRIEWLSRVLKDQYGKAQEYFVEQRSIREKNMKTNICVEPRVVVIPRDNINKKRNKPKYRMEDL